MCFNSLCYDTYIMISTYNIIYLSKSTLNIMFSFFRDKAVTPKDYETKEGEEINHAYDNSGESSQG